LEGKIFSWDGKNHVKLVLNSWRGKLINKFARPKWFSHKATKKRNKTVVIRDRREKKIFRLDIFTA
jgi:hypothetical protein